MGGWHLGKCRRAGNAAVLPNLVAPLREAVLARTEIVADAFELRLEATAQFASQSP